MGAHAKTSDRELPHPTRRHLMIEKKGKGGRRWRDKREPVFRVISVSGVTLEIKMGLKKWGICFLVVVNG
jgi:hypothetical protein